MFGLGRQRLVAEGSSVYRVEAPTEATPGRELHVRNGYGIGTASPATETVDCVAYITTSNTFIAYMCPGHQDKLMRNRTTLLHSRTVQVRMLTLSIL